VRTTCKRYVTRPCAAHHHLAVQFPSLAFHPAIVGYFVSHYARWSRADTRSEPRHLDLLSTPASGLGLAHVGRGLDRRNELEGDVGDTNDANDATGDLAEDLVAEDETADEDVEDSATDEGEEERGVARDLRGDLELEQRDAETEDDQVDADNNGGTGLIVSTRLSVLLERMRGGGEAIAHW